MARSESHRGRSDRHTDGGAFQTQYRCLYVKLQRILIDIDPLLVHATDETAPAPEIASILARLYEARVADDVERIVLEELHRWYGRRRLITIDGDRLADATIAICVEWNHFLANTQR